MALRRVMSRRATPSSALTLNCKSLYTKSLILDVDLLFHVEDLSFHVVDLTFLDEN